MTHALRFGVAYDFRNPPESGIDNPSLYAAILEQVAWLDGLGLDLAWFTEHHFVDDGYLPSWVPIAGAMAARTKRIRFNTDICLLPFNHPIRLAEDLAVLDNLSNGRVEIGCGMGYAPHEFRGFGMPVSRRVSFTDEGVEVLKRCFTGEKFSFHGKRYQFDDVRITPGYVQQGGPPLWLAAMAKGGALRAAKHRTHFLPQGARDQVLDPWRDALRTAGRRCVEVSRRHHSRLPRYGRSRARLAAGARSGALSDAPVQPFLSGIETDVRQRRHADSAIVDRRRRESLRHRTGGVHQDVRHHRHRDVGRAAGHPAAGHDREPRRVRNAGGAARA